MRSEPAPGRRPAALLVAACIVAVEGAALLGFAAWLLLRRTSEQPSNANVFQGATAFVVVLGLLVLAVAAALWLQKRWAFGAGVFVQLLGLGLTYQMATGGFWSGAAALGLACVCALVALFSAPSRAVFGRSGNGDRGFTEV
jgi:hypothetical protein